MPSHEDWTISTVLCLWVGSPRGMNKPTAAVMAATAIGNAPGKNTSERSGGQTRILGHGAFGLRPANATGTGRMGNQ